MKNNSFNNEQILNKGVDALIVSIPLKFVSQISNICIVIVLVKVLSTEEFGIYSLLYSSIVMISMFSSLGITNVLQRYVPVYLSDREFYIAKLLMYSCVVVRIVITGAIVLFVLLYWEDLSPYLKLQEYKYCFIVFIFIIFLHQQWGIIEIFLNSFYLHKYTLICTNLFIIAKLIGYILVYLLDSSFITIIYVDLISYLSLVILLLIVFRYKFPISKNERKIFNKGEVRKMIKYGMFYNFNDLGTNVLNDDIDNYLIAYFLDPFSVGLYSFSTRLSKIFYKTLPLNFLREVVRPVFFSIGVGSEEEKRSTAFSLFFKSQYIVGVPILFLLMCVGEEFIAMFFSSEYTDSYYLLILVFGFMVLNSFTTPIGFVAQLEERAGVVLMSKIFIIYNLIAAIILIPRFGVVGAAIATGSARLMKDVFIWFFLRKSAKVDGMYSFGTKMCLFWGGFALLFFWFKDVFANHYIILSAILMVMPIVVYFYIKIELFSKNEKIMISKLIKKISRFKKLDNLYLKINPFKMSET